MNIGRKNAHKQKSLGASLRSKQMADRTSPTGVRNINGASIANPGIWGRSFWEIAANSVFFMA
jgi:hypothetical protein